MFEILEHLPYCEMGATPMPKVIKLFHARLSRKFIMLINVKMPTIVGILTISSMIYTASESLKARNFKNLYFLAF